MLKAIKAFLKYLLKYLSNIHSLKISSNSLQSLATTFSFLRFRYFCNLNYYVPIIYSSPLQGLQCDSLMGSLREQVGEERTGK